jgi:hypothetical protein
MSMTTLIEHLRAPGGIASPAHTFYFSMAMTQ